MSLRLAAACGVLALIATPALAQPTISRVIPDAAGPGDTIIIEGSNLLDTQVSFRAVVGGFIGTTAKFATVNVSTPTRLELTLPQFSAFSPPTAFPPGDPNGTVSVFNATGAASANFFYMEGTWLEVEKNVWETPTIVTSGQGSVQSTGQGRAVATFDVKTGPPTHGNALFAFELQNAVPSSNCAILVGTPSPVTIPIAGGLLAINPLIAVPLATDALGEARITVAIPPLSPPNLYSFGVWIGSQWAIIDGGVPGMVVISNAMSFLI